MILLDVDILLVKYLIKYSFGNGRKAMYVFIKMTRSY